MKLNYYLTLLLILNLIFTVSYGQENIAPLKNNSILINKWKTSNMLNQRISSASDTLVLPVIDDFSLDDVFPNQSIWCDSNVYINSDFPIDPPTVGVATFDGLNKYGNAYFTVTSGLSGIADYLTSLPINLFEDDNMNLYLPSDSIFLSFFLQQKGLGESPDATDSLYVEFFNPSDSTWTVQWSKRGDTDNDFIRYKISIVDTAYFKNGFQFRFVNYGNLTGNLDHWHLDYVILKRNLNLAVDTLIDDIGFVENVNTLLKNFTAIPYSHYKHLAPNQDSVLVDSVFLKIRNNFNGLRIITSKSDNIYDENNNQIFNNSISANNINPNEVITHKFSLGSFAFPITQPGDSAKFTLVDDFVPSSGDLIKTNDTIKFEQKLYDYYSYDDGSAEAGYFLSAVFSEMAISYDLLKSDTLRGVYIHFTPINADVSNERFTLKIWKSINFAGGTDSVIYQRINFKPEYDDVVNGFHYYELDSLIPVDGRIYVGFQQISAAHLNVGLDLNMNASGKMYFNTTGSWSISQVQGAWMIRPVFGDTLLYSGTGSEIQNELDFTIYPNPSSNSIKIRAYTKSNDTHLIEVYNLLGELVLTRLYDTNSIDISALDSGLYIIRLSNSRTGTYSSKKLLINR